MNYKKSITLIDTAIKISYDLLDKYDFIGPKEEIEKKKDAIDNDIKIWSSEIGNLLNRISNVYLQRINHTIVVPYHYEGADETRTKFHDQLIGRIKVMNDIRNEMILLWSNNSNERLARVNNRLGFINILVAVVVGIATILGVYLTFNEWITNYLANMR